MVDVPEASLVIVMIQGGSLTLAIGEDYRGAIDICVVSRGVELLEVSAKISTADGESALRITSEN